MSYSVITLRYIDNSLASFSSYDALLYFSMFCVYLIILYYIHLKIRMYIYLIVLYTY